MENKLNLNLQASNYIPKNRRDNQPLKKFDDSGVENTKYNSGGSMNYSRAANYYNFDQNYSDPNNYSKGKKVGNKGRGGYNDNPDTYYQQDQYSKGNYNEKYKNNYEEYHQPEENYNQYENYDNTYEEYHQPEQNYNQYEKHDNYKNNQSTNYYDNRGNKGYKKYDKKEYGAYNKGSNQTYEKGYDKTYEKPYNKQNEKTYEQKYKTYEKQYDKPNEKQYDKPYEKQYNKPYDKPYEKSYKQYDKPYEKTYEKPYEKPYDNSYSKKKDVRNVEKDISETEVMHLVKQDLQDDYFKDEFATDFTGDTGEDFGEEYDYYGEENYGEEDMYDFQEKFDDMKVSRNRTDPRSLPEGKSETGSKKHALIFSNKDAFTEYVDDKMSKERRAYSNITDSYVNVLMIAEKPSIAKSLSEALGGKVKTINRGRANFYAFDGYFGNSKARFTVSSVMGHVYTSDFQSQHNKWDAIDYLDLYDVPVAKKEANKKGKVPIHLQNLGKGKDILCLWLDCDKEGENICYEVIYNCYPFMNKKSYQQVYRAKFSSLTQTDLKAAFNKMKDPPNKTESLSVDARQVIDLKIGVTFTRFFTSAILPGIKNVGTNLLSYGPCQTPTLWFCVNRQDEIDRFVAKEYFKVYAEIEHLKMKYQVPFKTKFFDKSALSDLLISIQGASQGKVVSVSTRKKNKQPPAGMNTVQMLRIASTFLKMSPHETMVVAEKLYTMGYITYPRTETTKYASSFDFSKALGDFSSHSVFGKSVTALIKSFKKPALRGVDVGDHPPITPSRVGSPTDLKADYWKLYELICSNFFASLSDAAEYEEKSYQLEINGAIFEADSSNITKEGFFTFMSWKRKNYVKDFPILKENSVISVLKTYSESNWTEPPNHLSESDLIKLMEHNKIGTDASMPVHIENITQRGYVKVDSNRRLTPTRLGKALIETLSAVDPEIVQPTVRSEIENFVDQVAKGTKTYYEVLTYTINLYKKKFLIIRQNYEKILNGFKKYFEIDYMEMNKVYQNIRSKNEALRIQNQVKRE